MILETKDLSIGYKGNPLFSNLNLKVGKGELTCLLGPNGAGKTTLIHTLIGMLQPVSGEVRVKGKSIGNLSAIELSRYIAVVLSQKLTPINLSVFDIVALGRTPHTNWLGHLSSTDKNEVHKAMELVNIRQFSKRFIHELSDGERQKVMIARALAQDTPLLVLDEPTAHLDIGNRVELLTLLKDLARETQKAILLSTHELEMSIQLADTVWLITSGGELKSGSPEDLILTGRIGETFQTDKVSFDIHSGSFQIKHESKGEIDLIGGGTLKYWTEHALRKEGFTLTARPDVQPRIELDEGAKSPWKVINGDISVELDSIKELIACTRQLTKFKKKNADRAIFQNTESQQ